MSKRRKRPIHLKDEDRNKLLYGPYESPLVKRGFLVDAVRGPLLLGDRRYFGLGLFVPVGDGKG